MSIVVTARDANQQFSEILGKAVAGETIIITRHGQPAAVLSAYRPETVLRQRARSAWDRMLAIWEKGVPVPPGGWVWNRDELYERD